VSLKYVCQQDTQPQSHRQPHRQLPADLTAALEFYLAIRLTGSPTGALVQGIRMLELVGVSNVVDGVTTIDDVNLSLSDDGINILLGPTLSGKTSLMRIMAGLDKPSAGDVLFEGESVLGVAVQKRNVAMVYQQFINYPSLTVFENIASPLRVAKMTKRAIEQRVQEAAQLLQIDDLLTRIPDQLSGGQQQRVALARAFAKRARLVLLDEPLANLDYKLREELRAELPRLFAEQGAVLVYATTEPLEALQLGGKTALLHEGRVVQHGTTIDVFQRPRNLRAAAAFSDPPLNTLPVQKRGGRLSLADQHFIPGSQVAELADGAYSIGIRPHHISLQATASHRLAITGRVSVVEISGSESFVHFDFDRQSWVALVPGIETPGINENLCLYLDPDKFYYFHDDGQLALAPGV
jgi:glycerol transport system ATP-binding protein